MLFTTSGSANVRNRRVVVFGEELPQRPNSSVDRQDGTPQTGRNSQGSASCPETFQTYASSPTRDRSGSGSRSGSRTETLQPGHWTAVTSQVKFRTLTSREEQEVFEAQKREKLLREQSGEYDSFFSALR